MPSLAPLPIARDSTTESANIANDRQGLRVWRYERLARLHALKRRTPATPLHRLTFPGLPGIRVYLKDERAHPSGSLKHRLAASLFEHALCHGWLTPGAPVIEASSGSTAVSEAWFARRLGLPFIAVVPRGTARAKLDAITAEGGRVHAIDDAAALSSTAARLADELGGHFMDQFRFASEASDWRGDDNLAAESLRQFDALDEPAPQAIFLGAGTGGTAATFARHLRLRGLASDIRGVDPQCSVYRSLWAGHSTSLLTDSSLGPNPIEGIGRPCPAQAFLPQAFDDMQTIEDAASLATARWLNECFGLCAGPSTGTALIGALRHAECLHERGEHAVLLALICDDGQRYRDTLYNDAWLERRYPAHRQYADELARITAIGRDSQ
ncbi:cysteine synthase A [Modicisalibacter muralis]|uniref:Cysteine synthase A n=1 Tax=Modicisalibacter muralis TaxID=119000 RepID=A0A1G9I418_9GAMM|nr:pyridoxal-phosphate dependent enzyme [Halomonas muralis]SDL19806.1 cysteine synthase A [Halomonas muralis]